MNLERPVYSHQRLDVYCVALEFAKKSSALRVSPASLADQFTRSRNSIVLNIAEGAQQVSQAMAKKHYRIALGSAAEAAACLDLIAATSSANIDGLVPLINRVGLMLQRLAR
jgi:four helix bundle protein